MSDIKILHPPQNYILYGTSLDFRYKIQTNLTKKFIKTLYLKLNDKEVEIDYNLGKYTFDSLESGDYTLTGYFRTNEGKKVNNTEFVLNLKVIAEQFQPKNTNWYTIKEKLPQFIKEDHKTFTKFAEAYYEWLQKSNNPIYAIFNSETFSDIDTTPEIFLESFRTQYLNDFPINVLQLNDNLNLRTVIKNIKQFYSSKGTEKSFRFLFRLLYNAYVEIYYPRKDLLVASGNLWVERKTIRVRGLTWNEANNIKKSVVYQKQPGTNKIISSARIIDVTSFKINNEDVFELNVDNIVGKFDLYDSETTLEDYQNGYVGEKVYVEILDGNQVSSFEVYMINGITSIAVSNTGMSVGEYIIVEPTGSSTGNLFSGVIKEVNEKGIPTSITILNHGYDYRGALNTFSIKRKNVDNTSTILTGTVQVGKLIQETGYYNTIKSSPSSGGVIRDNRKYQEMSYVLKTELSPERYIDAVKKLVHPAGIGVFSDVLIKDNNSIPPKESGHVNQYITPYIGNYLPYTFNTTKNLRNDLFEYGDSAIYPNGLTDLYPSGYNPTAPIPNEIYASIEHVPNVNQQLKDKVDITNFVYLPTVSDIENVNKYWVVYPNPNTTLGIINTNVAIKDLTIKNFVQFFSERIVISTQSQNLFAPPGYHYMPDGTLMLNSEMPAPAGYHYMPDGTLMLNSEMPGYGGGVVTTTTTAPSSGSGGGGGGGGGGYYYMTDLQP